MEFSLRREINSLAFETRALDFPINVKGNSRLSLVDAIVVVVN